MLLHYLKIAFRNLWKYKSQTLISLLGLSIGFTCFSLAMLWIRYEMTYDSFHKNAKHMYVVYTGSSGFRHFHSHWAGYLKETFPEIAEATAANIDGSRDYKISSSFVRCSTT